MNPSSGVISIFDTSHPSSTIVFNFSMNVSEELSSIVLVLTSAILMIRILISKLCWLRFEQCRRRLLPSPFQKLLKSFIREYCLNRIEGIAELIMCPRLMYIRLTRFASRNNLRAALCSGDDMMASSMCDHFTELALVNFRCHLLRQSIRTVSCHAVECKLGLFFR